MDSPTIACTKCNSPLSAEIFTTSSEAVCGVCGTPLTVRLFPAFDHPTLLVKPPERVLTDTEAGCFFHPAKKAVTACEACGRFLCALCELEWEGLKLCGSCLEAGRKKGKIRTLENSRVLYDHIALSVSVLPAAMLVTWFMTCVTAPLAIFLSLWYWKAPGSIVSRTKMRYVVAIVLALVQIAGWIWMIAEITHAVRSRG